MLTWTQRQDGWYADEYVIRLVRPFCWALTQAEDAPEAAVSIPTEPLATGRTLTECKREAELIASARSRADTRRRQCLLLLISISAALMMLGAPFGGNGLALLVVGILAVRSTAILLGTLIPSAFGEQHEVFYQ